MYLDFHAAANRVHREVALSRPTGGVEEAGENAQAVARLFGFAAVGIQNAQAVVGAISGFQREDAIAADAPVAIADVADIVRCEFKFQFGRIHDDIVVAETVALVETVFHKPSG